MKKIRRFITTIVVIAAFIGGAVCADGFNLDFLSFKKATYDLEILKEQVTEISEMATIEYKYLGDAEYDGGAKQIGKFEIPFTSKSMIVRYEGIIKLGANLSKIKIEPVEGENKVVITIPHSKILSHEIDNDTWEIIDLNNGLFNRVTLEDNNEFVKEQKKIIEKEVLGGDLPEQADEKTADQLANFLKMAYPDLEVEVKFSK